MAIDSSNYVKRHDSRTSSVVAYRKSILGVQLEDLRGLVAAAEGMDGASIVHLEDLADSATYKGVWHARRISVRGTVKDVATDD